MLNKLIRYEFRATARILGILYLALILLSIINRFSMGVNFMDSDEFNFGVLSGILVLTLYVVCAAATMILTIVMIVIRFWRNLMENEGYLMHTLPVRARDHLFSKLLVAFVWMLVSTLAITISIWITTSGIDGFENLYPEVSAAISNYFSIKGSVPCFLLFIVLLIVSTIAEILKLYAAMCLGQSLSEHRVAASIGIYVGFNILESIFESVIIMISGITQLSVSDPWFNSFYPAISDTGAITDLSGFAALEALGLLLPVLYSVIYFFLSKYFLEKKLNLV